MTSEDPALPSGVVAFLFSDIEGSTKLLHRLGLDYRHQLEQYRVLLTGAFQRHDGIPLGSEGDSLFVAFERVSSALAAAVAGQLALEGHGWPEHARVRARMGVHVGEVQRLGDGYVGMAIHLAARVCAFAHGGQILTTDVAHRLSPSVSVLDLGEHSLRDVGAVRIMPVQHPELTAEFPPLRVVTLLPNNLPAPQDGFIGRAVELAESRAALAEARLVTLTGPGGTGKTRLALELARIVLPDHRDGVWFVPLASASDGDQLVPLVAAALHLGERSDESLDVTLEKWLRGLELLLVLDNCEHLVGAVAGFADRFLTTCSQLCIVATSREILGVRAERALRVPPLGTQDDPASGTSDAIDLLLARAEAMAPDLDVAAVDRQLAAQICRRLDGLPLAIELAAARLRALSLEQLASRLDDRFRLLTGGSRTDLPRHQTLQAVVTWSYDLLVEPERHMFRRLSVFADEFSLEAAETVVCGPPVEQDDVLNVLTRLVEKSLLSIVPSAGGYRYRLLETLRQYGRDRLVEAGEVVTWRNRLLEWAVRQVADVERTLRTPSQDAAIARVIMERENLRLAMVWAREVGQDEAALRIVSAVPMGPNGERRQLITDVLADVSNAGKLDDEVAGRAWTALANLAFEQGDWAYGIDVARRGFACFDRVGDHLQRAWARSLEMYLEWGAGNLEAVDHIVEELVRVFRSLADDMGLGYTLWTASLRTPDLDMAFAMGAEADALLRRVGSPMAVAHNVEGRGIVAYDRGDLVSAAEHVAEAVTLFSGRVNYGCTAHALEAAAVVLAASGLYPSPAIPAEILTAAEAMRDRSGQRHRPWEIRARHGAIEDLMGTAEPAAVAAEGQHTLASAASLAIDALEQVRDA